MGIAIADYNLEVRNLRSMRISNSDFRTGHFNVPYVTGIGKEQHVHIRIKILSALDPTTNISVFARSSVHAVPVRIEIVEKIPLARN